MGFFHFSQSELISFSLIVLKGQNNGYDDTEIWKSVLYPSSKSASIALGLYSDGFEYEKCVDELVRA